MGCPRVYHGTLPTETELTKTELQTLISNIEESYEFFLAYAAQGITDESASNTGGELRRFLARMDGSLDTIVQTFRDVVEAGADTKAEFHSMLDVLEQDVARASAAVKLVMARPSISSQLIDNLNASIHVRALLTDLFVLDEALPSAKNVQTTD